MGFFKRLFGICDTKPPADAGCFRFTGGKVEIDPARALELSEPGGAIRLEGQGLPLKVLVFRDGEGRLFALENRCTHAGRRLDPLPGGAELQCCSLGKSRFDAEGKRLAGMARDPIRSLAVDERDGSISIALS